MKYRLVSESEEVVPEYPRVMLSVLNSPRHLIIEKENTRNNHRFHYFSNNLSMIVLSYTIDFDYRLC